MRMKISDCFPMQSYRPGQKQAIERILALFDSGKKFILLEAPTGAGKSAIGFTVAQMMQNCYYLTPQKIHQDQFTADFGENGKHLKNSSPFIELKGRNNYPCTYWQAKLQDDLDEKQKEEFQKYAELDIRCDVGYCKRHGKSSDKYCVDENNSILSCPYFQQLAKAMASKNCLMNFSSFLFQTAVVSGRFGQRDLLILDEGHSIEDALMSFIEIKLSDRLLAREDIKLPKYETAAEYLKYFQKIELSKIIDEKIRITTLTMQSKEAEEWQRIKIKYNLLLKGDPNNLVCIYEEKHGASKSVILKPIFISDYTDGFLFSYAKHVLLISATILSKTILCESLGMDPEETAYLKLGSTFPKENRPVLFRPAGSMSYKNKSSTLPKLAEAIDEICNKHLNERGIVHTHTFEIAEYLLNNCKSFNRFICPKEIRFKGDKYKMLEAHKEREDSVIVSPGLSHGLDLKDEAGRFQIICKVPYPPMNDPQIAMRLKLSENYFNWRAMTSTIQSCGRIVRHDKDHGITYVLDSDFKRFCQMNKHLIPGWFDEAIKWEVK